MSRADAQGDAAETTCLPVKDEGHSLEKYKVHQKGGAAPAGEARPTAVTAS